MSAQRREQLSQAEELTRQMELAAAAGNMDEVSERYAERESLIRQLFRPPYLETESRTLADAIQSLQEADDRILALLVEQRDSAAAHLQTLRLGRKAMDAYRQHS